MAQPTINHPSGAADEQPPEDIQVLGKTQNMEMRVVLWNTKETACKDNYTSDVYISCELMGAGQPKQTDVHYGVKKGAFGMFNWRLKWRCKYPSTTLEYLMRIQVRTSIFHQDEVKSLRSVSSSPCSSITVLESS